MSIKACNRVLGVVLTGYKRYSVSLTALLQIYNHPCCCYNHICHGVLLILSGAVRWCDITD